MKEVKIKLANNNDLIDMFKDLQEDGYSQYAALEMVMGEVQIRTIMERKYKKWAESETNIIEEDGQTIALVKMEKWKNL